MLQGHVASAFTNWAKNVNKGYPIGGGRPLVTGCYWSGWQSLCDLL